MAIILRRKDTKNTSRVPLTYYSSGRPSSAKSPFQPSKSNKNRNLGHLLIRIRDWGLALAILISLGYSLSLKPSPHLKINDLSYHSFNLYQDYLEAQFKSLTNRNKITINEKGIAKAMQSQFPEIANVSIELPIFSRTSTVNLTIKAPKFILDSKGLKYVINSGGTAVGTTDNPLDLSKLINITDDSGFPISVGKPVLSESQIAFINTIVEQCRHAGIGIKKLSLPAAPQEIYLRTTDRPYFVKFYLGGDPLIQSGQFIAARKHFDSTHLQPSQYLDVRIAGKIFYK